jgi:hypothetical protein
MLELFLQYFQFQCPFLVAVPVAIVEDSNWQENVLVALDPEMVDTLVFHKREVVNTTVQETFHGL